MWTLIKQTKLVIYMTYLHHHFLVTIFFQIIQIHTNTKKYNHPINARRATIRFPTLSVSQCSHLAHGGILSHTQRHTARQSPADISWGQQPPCGMASAVPGSDALSSDPDASLHAGSECRPKYLTLPPSPAGK